MTLTWDELNRLKSASDNFSLGSSVPTNQSYVYDPLDRRISKTITSGAGTSTNYLYNGDDIHAEYASTSWAQPNAISAYAGTDQTIARISLTNGQLNNALYLHADAQGSTDVVTQYNGTATDTTSGAVLRDPWGVVLTAQPLANTVPDFQGRPKDETGLRYFRARYLDIDAMLDLSTNRFISRDPTGYAGGINPYVAFENDPLTYSDPTGTTASFNKGIASLGSTASYFSNVSNAVNQAFAPSASYQNLNTVQYNSSPVNTTQNVQTALNFASAIPVVGIPFSIASAAIDTSQGHYGSAAFGIVTAIPFIGTVGKAGRVADALLDVARGESGVARGEVNVYRVFGGDARAQGFSWTTKDPRTVSNFRDAAGLPSGGASGATNTADFLVIGRANASDIIKSRSALPLDGNKGGLPELIIDPKNVRITDFSVLKP